MQKVVVTLIQNGGKVFPRLDKPIRIALYTDGENDALGLVGGLVGLDAEEGVLLDDLENHLRPIDLALELPNRIVPDLEDPLTGPGFKRQLAAEGNHAGLRHDEFFLLIVEDCVGKLAPFEDEDAQAFFLAMTRRAQSRGPCPNNQQIIDHKVILIKA